MTQRYLARFDFPDEETEAGYLLGFPAKLEMHCYSDTNVYPFKVLPSKGLTRLTFEPLTILYGSNGSGKSTVLNIMAEKLGVKRTAPFNRTPFLEDYLTFCHFGLDSQVRELPSESEILTSDGVFDFLLDVRAVNEGIDRRRNAFLDEYDRTRKADQDEPYLLRSLDDYEEFRRHNEVRRRTKSAYVTRRIPKELDGRSNGESAYVYFTQKIRENALYLLDEPENSLSAAYQKELAGFLVDSARFYGCQFIIASHSPFLLAMKGAKVYDLDASPAAAKRWTELANMRLYHELFSSHAAEFD